MSNLSIRVKNLSKVYNNHTVLHSLSFSFEENGIFGLLGRNGAGKTTLLGILMGNAFTPRPGMMIGLDFTQQYILKLGIIFLGNYAYQLARSNRKRSKRRNC